MRYHNLRDALSTDLADEPSYRIDRALGPDLADSLESISGALSTVGQHLKHVAPAVLQGAATGLVVGGPAGAAVGAVGGLTGLIPGAPKPPGAVPAPSPAPAQTAIANPAAAELLLLLSRPEVINALIAMALGT